MKRSSIPITGSLACLVLGCSCGPDLQRVSLQCKAPFKAQSFMGWYSFRMGDMTDCLTGRRVSGKCSDVDKTVDLAYYFDRDDCSQGAILGHDDHGGSLVLIGHQSWSELSRLEPPSDGCAAVEAIVPLTRDKEGLAFWVRTSDGEYVLARIKTVEPARYADLVSGRFPTVELEWARPNVCRKQP